MLKLIIFTIMTYQDLTYNRTYKYPAWALRFGWFLSISSFICIPVFALYKFIFVGGSFKEVCFSFNSQIDVKFKFQIIFFLQIEIR